MAHNTITVLGVIDVFGVFLERSNDQAAISSLYDRGLTARFGPKPVLRGHLPPG
jgi:hypothetical protein